MLALRSQSRHPQLFLTRSVALHGYTQAHSQKGSGGRSHSRRQSLFPSQGRCAPAAGRQRSGRYADEDAAQGIFPAQALRTSAWAFGRRKRQADSACARRTRVGRAGSAHEGRSKETRAQGHAFAGTLSTEEERSSERVETNAGTVMAKRTKNSLVANINRRRRAGKSRPKSRSTVSKSSYRDMQRGWPKRRARKSAAKRKTARTARRRK
jgi:hypothetical protein